MPLTALLALRWPHDRSDASEVCLPATLGVLEKLNIERPGFIEGFHSVQQGLVVGAIKEAYLACLRVCACVERPELSDTVTVDA